MSKRERIWFVDCFPERAGRGVVVRQHGICGNDPKTYSWESARDIVDQLTPLVEAYEAEQRALVAEYGSLE